MIIPDLKEGQKTIYRLKYKKQLGLANIDDLEKRINSAITDHLIYTKTNITRSRLDSIRAASDIGELKTFSDEGKKSEASSQGLSYAVGYVCGFLIYLLTFIYGAMVMRGVSEEKTSRVAEVIVSSVKPFPLMLGKIIGIGAVGLTQFFLWIGLFVVLVLVAQAFIPHETLMEMQNIQQANAMGNGQSAQASEAARQIFSIQAIHAAYQLAAHHRLLRILFYRRLFILCLSVCCHRFRGKRRSAGSPVAFVAHQYAHYFFFHHHVRRNPGSGRFTGGLEQYDSLQFTDRNDGPNSLRSTDYCSILAAIVKHGITGRRIFIYNMDGWQNLPYRHPALWKKTKLEDDVEVGVH